MARWETEQTVTQSILERLIDRDPTQSADPAPTRAQSVRQLKASLRRDLEWLLNTRRTPRPATSEFAEVEKSLYNFGLQDMTNLAWDSSRDRARLSRMIEQTVQTFEPRITGLKVVALDSMQGLTHVLRFQIQGLLDMDPAPEHISFDTVLQLSSGEYQVRGDGSAG
ncbi:MAG TPA: type VI secretion system baseplate subunit TssE [Candidatus Sulfopaludibacter sp.]|jgi:type VI secretion system protein ImpF|nr:type VI secretion system baseplate subunit TssE [Candidatus Sulfopaludibacter sp.]